MGGEFESAKAGFATWMMKEMLGQSKFNTADETQSRCRELVLDALTDTSGGITGRKGVSFMDAICDNGYGRGLAIENRDADVSSLRSADADRLRSVVRKVAEHVESEMGPGTVRNRALLEQSSGKDIDKAATNLGKCVSRCRQARDRAQGKFNTMCREMEDKCFEGNSNAVKRKCVSGRIPFDTVPSGSGVAVSDPTLRLDQVALNRATAKLLGVREGDPLLVSRPPTLKDSTRMTLHVHVDDDVNGVAVHPLTANLIGADFDGDQFGVMAFNHTRPAEVGRDMMRAFDASSGVYQSLVTFDDDNVAHIAFSGGSDIKRAMHNDEAFGTAYKEATKAIEDFATKFCDGVPEMRFHPDFARGIEPHVAELERVIADGMVRNTGLSTGAIDRTDARSIVDSYERVCVETGAKGNMDALVELSGYAGIRVDVAVNEGGRETVTATDMFPRDADGNLSGPRTCHTEEQDRASQEANGLKGEATGMMGRIQRDGEAASTDKSLVPAVNAVASILYQKSLDWKKDGASAIAEYLIAEKEVVPLLHHGGRMIDDKRERLNVEDWTNAVMSGFKKMGADMPRRCDVERLGESMSDYKGNVMGTAGVIKAGSASSVLMSAFSGSIEPMLSACRAGNVYAYQGGRDGNGLSDIAPRSVREAWAESMQHKAKSVVIDLDAEMLEAEMRGGSSPTKTEDKAADKSADKTADNAADKAADKASDKTAADKSTADKSAADKTTDKPTDKPTAAKSMKSINSVPKPESSSAPVKVSDDVLKGLGI
jgi:hypothetical protein